MKVIIAKNYEELSSIAAKKVADLVKSKPDAKLGLPTGSTPIGMYKELIAMNKKGHLSFKDVITFNLDEYEGLDKNYPNSYYRFMKDNFFSHIDIEMGNTNIPNGMSSDISRECID